MAKVLTSEQQIAELTARVARLEGKQGALKQMPSEPVQHGACGPVVWFAKTWGSPEGAMYQYVANRVKGKGWVISHQSKKTYMTWNEILLFALLREPDGYIPPFYIADGWSELKP